jgi:hypothetical protein
MIRLVLYVVLLTVATSSNCQKTSFTRDDHLRKSKHAKTTAWILLGSGVASITYGIIAGLSNGDDPELYYGMVIIGIPLMIASVPFFNSSVRHKEKANSLSAGIELKRLNGFPMMKNKNGFIPALALSLNL